MILTQTDRLAPPTDPAWQDRAACRGQDIDTFFDEAPETREEALAVCGPCPVRADCFDAALAAPEHFGIWGGASPNARKAERRRRLRGHQPRYPGPPQPKKTEKLPARVASLGTVRRLQALQAEGHSTVAVAEAASCSPKTVSAWSHHGHQRGRIDAGLARAIEQAYQALAGRTPQVRPGPGLSPQSRRERAAARGWAASTQWAGIDINDPAARPRPDAAHTTAA